MDKTLAALYFKLSAAQGNADAQFHHGRLRTRVEGIAMDESQGAHYSRLWEDQGTMVGSSPEEQALRATRLLAADEAGARFRFVINGTPIETGVTEAAAFSPAVALELSVDACVRTFTVRDSRISGTAAREFECLLFGRSIPRAGANTSPLNLLFGRLSNSDLERMFFPTSTRHRSASTVTATSKGISLLSVDTLDALLSEGSITIDSEASLLSTLLRLGPDFFPLLHHIRWSFLSFEEIVSFLSERGVTAPPKLVWRELCFCLQRFFAPPPFDSVIVSGFPEPFTQFIRNRIALLWRGSRDGFDTQAFRRHCGGHNNILTVILDSDGNIFGGFTLINLCPNRRDIGGMTGR